MTSFDALASHYDVGRLGYSHDLYNALLGFGLTPRDRVLDCGCGTGLASRPLIENGFRVTGVDVSEPMLAKAREHFPSATWVQGNAEALPFEPRTFDTAISAQVFHHLDRTKAINELMRVVRPDGIVAIWWKVLMNDDPVKMVRDSVVQSLGVAPPNSWLSGGFKEFYASPLRDHSLRVIPWHVVTTFDGYLQYERSRTNVREALGARATQYFELLENRLRETYSGPSIPLGYLQFLYMAKV